MTKNTTIQDAYVELIVVHRKLSKGGTDLASEMDRLNKVERAIKILEEFIEIQEIEL